MRGKGSWKRLFAVILTAALLAIIPEGAFATEDKEEWDYENSLLITVSVENERSFTPADFPAVSCKFIWVTEKTKTEQGVGYELMLVLKNGGDLEIEKAIEKISQEKMVKSVHRNDKFAAPKSSLSLSKSLIYLKVGETADVTIQNVNLVENSFHNIGVAFEVDPGIYSADTLNEDSFLQYGILRYWPETDSKEEILLQKPNELEAVFSKNGKYYGLVSDSDSLIETVSNFAALPGVLCVSVVRMEKPSGQPPYEEWSVNKSEIIDLRVSGGNVPTGFGEEGPHLNQVATIKGLKPGVTTLRAEQGGFGAAASDKCIVIVYEPGSKDNPGDVNHDGKISAEDALQALKHTVGLELLDDNGKQTADLNDDNGVNAEDALLMMKIVVGSL